MPDVWICSHDRNSSRASKLVIKLSLMRSEFPLFMTDSFEATWRRRIWISVGIPLDLRWDEHLNILFLPPSLANSEFQLSFIHVYFKAGNCVESFASKPREAMKKISVECSHASRLVSKTLSKRRTEKWEKRKCPLGDSKSHFENIHRNAEMWCDVIQTSSWIERK